MNPSSEKTRDQNEKNKLQESSVLVHVYRPQAVCPKDPRGPECQLPDVQKAHDLLHPGVFGSSAAKGKGVCSVSGNKLQDTSSRCYTGT